MLVKTPAARLKIPLIAFGQSHLLAARKALRVGDHFGRRRLRTRLVTIEVNERLNELIKEAFATRNQLLSGSDASIEAMSGRIGMNKGRLTSLIRLSYLACNNGDPGPHHCRPTLCRSW